MMKYIPFMRRAAVAAMTPPLGRSADAHRRTIDPMIEAFLFLRAFADIEYRANQAIHTEPYDKLGQPARDWSAMSPTSSARTSAACEVIQPRRAPAPTRPRRPRHRSAARSSRSLAITTTRVSCFAAGWVTASRVRVVRACAGASTWLARPAGSRWWRATRCAAAASVRAHSELARSARRAAALDGSIAAEGDVWCWVACWSYASWGRPPTSATGAATTRSDSFPFPTAEWQGKSIASLQATHRCTCDHCPTSGVGSCRRVEIWNAGVRCCPDVCGSLLSGVGWLQARRETA